MRPPLAATGLAPSHASASVAPRATEAAWLTLLVSIAVFLGTLATPREKVKILIYVFVAIAASQAIIGLAQYGTSSYSVIFPGGEPVRNAHGTYANYDHLAGLLEMALPVALALLAASVHRKDSSPGRSKQKQTTSSRRLLQLGSNQVALFAAATVAILLGLIFSRSRTGISLTMFVVLISALAFARQIGGKSSARFVTAIVVVGIALAVEIGLAPVLARFTEQAVSSDSRWSIFAGTWFGIRHFMPIGSGLGTYPLAFRYFQGEDVPRFVNHAHNDYLEWLMDGGAALAIALLAAFGVYATRCLRFVLAAQWTSDTFYRTGAAIGVLAIGLHGLVDFNFHIPANAVFAALLLAVTMHTEPGRSTANTEIGMRTREDRHRTKQEGPTSGAVSKTPNPFAE